MIDEYDDIPGMPSAESIRAELLKTGDVPYWRPHGKPDGTPTDFAALPPELAEKQVSARLQIGPGPNGTPFQWVMFEHYQRIAELEKERDRLRERLTAVRGYDPRTGEGISAISPEESQQVGYRLLQVQEELRRINGKEGVAALERKLEEAVRAEQERYKREYMHAEAQRRAKAKAMDEEIDRLAEAYGKTLPRP